MRGRGFQGETIHDPFLADRATSNAPGFVDRHLEDPGSKAPVPAKAVQVTAKDQADVLNHVLNIVGPVR